MKVGTATVEVKTRQPSFIDDAVWLASMTAKCTVVSLIFWAVVIGLLSFAGLM